MLIRTPFSVVLLLLISACGTQTSESDEENGQNDTPVSIIETINDGDYQLLAVNDLGMHCADLDYQVFSILPPFNVLHAQLIKRGQQPQIIDNSSIDVTYHAISNVNDPILQNPGDLPSISTSAANQGSNYRSNFWEPGDEVVADGFAMAGASISIGGQAYAPLYPGVQVSDELGGADLDDLCTDTANESGCPSLLTAFEPLPEDTGLPVPVLEKLYPENLDTPALVVNQQQMPGALNEPQTFKAFVKDQVFFTQFDFGANLHDRNWFAAEGIPILPIDDQGRNNAYPMMRVTAKNRSDDSELARLDVVLPVASEADCQNCHVEPLDCNDAGLPSDLDPLLCNGSGVEQTAFNVMTLDDVPPGATRLNQLQNAAKINILRLHDAKHGGLYRQWDGDKNLVATPCDPVVDSSNPNCLANQTPLQCSQCHYTPALDLTQAGPVDEPEQGAEGRQQTYHQTMSRVMHAFHGKQDYDFGQGNEKLFPDMPAADDDLRTSGLPVNDYENDLLNQTCYQCHPGKNTQCLRGAMASAGVLCQDCHGDMEQVGNDFSLRVSSSNPGDFVLDGSLRVPWANEPGCQSCHTGDALNKNHPADAVIADDGLRLLQAYSDQNVNVSNIPQAIKTARVNSARNSRFAENTALNEKGDVVDVLYRLSKDDHGGVMCEGCHNSTHAIWPNQNPYANDNVAAEQLQGHSGTLSECSTCHKDQDLGNTLGGPHGMHPVGGGRFAYGDHEEVFEQNKSQCQACHGLNGEGTVLSRAFKDRSFMIEECEKGTLCPGQDIDRFTVNLKKGDQVSCDLCHKNHMVEDDDD